MGRQVRLVTTTGERRIYGKKVLCSSVLISSLCLLLVSGQWYSLIPTAGPGMGGSEGSWARMSDVSSPGLKEPEMESVYW